LELNRSQRMTATLSPAPLDQLSGFNAFDWFLVLTMAWSVAVAFARGIIRELFGLAGTILGLLLASWNYHSISPWLAQWITSPIAADVTAFLLIACAVLVLCTTFGRLVRGTAHTVGLGFFDRLAGAGFGLLRGFLLGVGVLITATAFFPPQFFIANSRLAPYFLAAAREVSFVVPQNLQRRLSNGIDSVRHLARR